MGFGGLSAGTISGIARGIQANWELHFSDTRRRIAVGASKQPHCLLDLIWRQRAGELPAEIPLIISNHPNLEPLARSFGIDVSPENKAEHAAGVSH